MWLIRSYVSPVNQNPGVLVEVETQSGLKMPNVSSCSSSLTLLVSLHPLHRAFKRGQEFAGGAGGLSVLMGAQPPSLETAPNTWPSHNSQWESRFTREGERLWHRLCPMTQLQGSSSPQCVDSVTARVEPWRIGCASLPIVLTPVNCGAGYQRAFSAWISHP